MSGPVGEIICTAVARMFCTAVFLSQTAFCVNCGLSTRRAGILPSFSQRRMYIIDRRLILLLFTLPAFVSADMRLYGDLKSGMEISQTKFGSKTSSCTGVSNLGSHIRMYGSYPMGGRSNVIWQMEQDTSLGQDKSDQQSDLRRGRGGDEIYTDIGR